MVESDDIVLVAEPKKEKTLLEMEAKKEVVAQYETMAGGMLPLVIAAMAGKMHDPPKHNIPCSKCKKPTRSHFDKRTGEVTCHECFLKYGVCYHCGKEIVQRGFEILNDEPEAVYIHTDTKDKLCASGQTFACLKGW